LTKEALDHYDPKKLQVELKAEVEARGESVWLLRYLNLGLRDKEHA
jgi:hypothetical protein